MSFYSINAHASILNEERTEYVGTPKEIDTNIAAKKAGE